VRKIWDEGKRLDTKHTIRIEVAPENKWQKPLGGELSSRVATSTDNLVRAPHRLVHIPSFLKPTL
jgi:hypothetical protein